MKKVVLVSDIHLTFENPESRLDNLAETQFKKLNYIYDWAEKNDAIVCQAGDYVNKPRSWYLLPLLAHFFMKWKGRVDTVMVRGQHDCYYYSEAAGPATVIGSLAAAEFLTIIGEKPLRIEMGKKTVRVYGASFGETIPTPAKFHPGNLLLTHREISDQALFEGHKYYSPKGFLKRHQNFGVILCADIHRKFKVSLKSSGKDRIRHLVNTGPMLRSSATNYNFEHHPGFYVWEPYNKLTWIPIPHKEADEVLSRSHIEAQEAQDRQMAELTLKLKNRLSENGVEISTDKGSFRNNLDEFVQEHEVSKEIAGYIYGGLAELDANDL